MITIWLAKLFEKSFVKVRPRLCAEFCAKLLLLRYEWNDASNAKANNNSRGGEYAHKTNEAPFNFDQGTQN